MAYVKTCKHATDTAGSIFLTKTPDFFPTMHLAIWPIPAAGENGYRPKEMLHPS
jgi:hypothetical protein